MPVDKASVCDGFVRLTIGIICLETAILYTPAVSQKVKTDHMLRKNFPSSFVGKC